MKFPSYFVGLVLKNIELPYPNHGHVVLAKPSPILFYPISSTEVGSAHSSAPLMRRCLFPWFHQRPWFLVLFVNPLPCIHAAISTWTPPPPHAITQAPSAPQAIHRSAVHPAFRFSSAPAQPPCPLRSLHPKVRCLVDVPGEKLPQDLPEYLRTHVAPEVPEELREAFLAALEGSTIRTMQNKQLTSKPLHQPGEALCVWGAGWGGIGRWAGGRVDGGWMGGWAQPSAPCIISS